MTKRKSRVKLPSGCGPGAFVLVARGPLQGSLTENAIAFYI
jgi:hypothetical protein